MRHLPGLLAALVLGAGAPTASAYNIILDMDATLPGIQSSITVTAGSTITVTGHLVSLGTGALFDHVGVDLSWAKPAEVGTLTPIGAPRAAGLAGVGTGPALDFFTSSVLAVGSTLTTTTLGPVGGNSFNLGGFAYFDSSFTFFGGLGSPFDPAGTSIDIFEADFLVGGPVGGSVSIDPSGIFAPGLFPPTPPLVAGGNALYDSVVTLFTFPGTYTGGVVHLVPEPTALLLGGVGLFTIWLRRHR